jgi:hypothetical protein
MKANGRKMPVVHLNAEMSDLWFAAVTVGLILAGMLR